MAYKTYVPKFRQSRYRIKKPSKDVCNFCTVCKHKLKYNPLDRCRVEYDLHTRKYRKYWAMRKELIASCKNNSEHLVLEFDFAQNLPVPRLNINEQFYCRLLWLYVFNVHLHNNSKSNMYWYLETESRKGSNSVVSLVYDAVSRWITPETNKITLLSDSAPGQNKNIIMTQFCLWLAKTLQVDVHHLYPVRGHSYGTCDRNFAHYSRKLKNFENLYTAGDYLKVIRQARKKNGPFKVIHAAMLVKDWSGYLSAQYMSTSKTKSTKFAVKSYVQMKYRQDGVVLASPCYSPVFTPFTFVRRERGSENEIWEMPRIPGRINDAKKRDVLKLVKYLPRNRRKWLKKAISV